MTDFQRGLAMKPMIFKMACILLGLTLVATITVGILMACQVLNASITPYIYLGLALYCEGVAIYFTKKSKKDGTNN